MSTCPHCGALATLEKSAPFRYRCGVCGGPVVPTVGKRTRTDAELAGLVAAQRAHAMGLGWLAAAIVLGAIAAMSAGLGVLLFFGHAIAAAIVLCAVGAVAASLSTAALFASRGRRAEVRRKLDDAWERAAEDMLRTRGEMLSAPELAAAMQTDDAHAAALLTNLSAFGRVHTHVRDDAELAYDVEAETDDDARARSHGR